MKITCIHLEGSKQGLTETINGEVISVGRDPSNSLSFDPFKDLDVSSRHASITVQNGQVMMQDLDSTNGTFLNGAKITGSVPLPHGGCMVQFGENGPKLQMNFDFTSGPGKKTRMIHDLQAEVSAAGLQADEAKKQKKRNTRIFILLGVLGLLGLGTYLLVSHHNEQKKLEEETESLGSAVESSKLSADKFSASEFDESKDLYEKAETARKEGEEAKEEEDLELAVKKLKEADDLYGKAQLAAIEPFQKRARKQEREELLADLEKKRAAEEEKDAKDQEDLANNQAEEERKKKEAERAAAKKKADEAAKAGSAKMLENLAELEKSENPDEIEGALSSLDEQIKKLKESGSDPAMVKKLEAKKKKLEKQLEVAKVAEKEKAGKPKNIAKKIQPSVVLIRTKVFGVPGGLRLDQTEVRHPVTETQGSGAVVSEKGHILTSKAVSRPELFDAEAMARAKLLKEKRRADLHRTFEILIWDAKKKGYVVLKKIETSEVKTGPDEFGDGEKVKIKFDNIEQEVEVEPHTPGPDAWAILRAKKAPKGKLVPIKLHEGEVAKDTETMILGVQKNKKDKKKRIILFFFAGKSMGTSDKVMDLGAPSVKSWRGGPVITKKPDPELLGVLVQTSTKKPYKSRAIVLDDIAKKLAKEVAKKDPKPDKKTGKTAKKTGKTAKKTAAKTKKTAEKTKKTDKKTK